MNSSQVLFFELLRAGLWEKDCNLSSYEEEALKEVHRIASEQSVVGLVAAGLEHMIGHKASRTSLLPFMAGVLQLEKKNAAMNSFIADIYSKMSKEGIQAIVLKGQGVAQYYERPLWRACGDVDFFLDDQDYQKARLFLQSCSSSSGTEVEYRKHQEMTIDGWVVELHGNLRGGFSTRVDKVLDKMQEKTFRIKLGRFWNNGEVSVPLLGLEDDVFYVFTHILQHFYKGGIGLRQVCDLCRMLWRSSNTLNVKELENLIKASGLTTEWVTFGSVAVDYLGMPSSSYPLYSQKKRWKRKARRVLGFIMMSGNFGHNRDFDYYGKYPYLIRKVISMGRRIGDIIAHARIFPLDSLRFMPRIIYNGIHSAINGE